MTFNPDHYLSKVFGEASTKRSDVSDFQERLFDLYSVRPKDTSYNMNSAFLLEGPIDVNRAEECSRLMVSRHEILRTAFDPESTPAGTSLRRVDIVAEQLNFTIHRLRDSSLETVFRRARDLSQKPFDLTKGPLHFVDLFELADGKYVFFLRMSHAIGDLFSMSEYFEQWADLYDGKALSKSNPFWKFVEREKSEISRRRWSLENPFQLPTDRPRGLVAYDSRLEVMTFDFPSSLEETLVHLGRKLEVTPFTVLFASYQILLSRISGLEEVLTKVPLTKRHDGDDFRHTIGPILDTVVVKGEISHEATFAELLAKTRENLNEAMGSSSAALDISLANNVFNYLPLPPMPTYREFQATHMGFVGPIPAGPCDLHFCFTGQENRRILSITYNADLYEKETISRLWERYLGILRQAVENENQRVSELSLISSETKRRLVNEWNATDFSHGEEGVSLAELVSRQAKKTPDAVALVFQERRWTYRDLTSAAARLGHFLSKKGVASGTRVALCLPRSEDLIVSILAVWKLGGIFVPLDVDHPKARLLQIIQDCDADVLLTESQTALFWKDPESTILLDQERSQVDREPSELPDAQILESDCAYVVYTSGSTGAPKGVLVDHRALKNVLFSVRESLEVSEQDTFVGVASNAFDISLADFFLPLISGGRLLLADSDEQRNPYALQKLIAQASVMSATPMTWRILIDTGWTGNGRLKAISTGEALSKSLADEILSRTRCLWNLYGPSETTIWSTCKKIREDEGVITIGRPIQNTQLYILDENRRPVDVGDVGEIYIGGHGVAHGYLGLDALTSEKFLTNPFCADQNSRVFKTGDLGRYLGNGDVQFLGRIDRQVKIQGYRIELEEVEAAVLSYTSVKSCVVMARRNRDDELDSLTAFIVAAGSFVRSEFDKCLKERLPDFMIPAEVVFLDTIPLTTSGKVHHQELWKTALDENRGPVRMTGGLDRQDVISTIERETKEVLAIRRDVRLDSRTGFFDLGLTSLTSIELKRRICSVFPFLDGANTPNTLIFRYPTIEKLTDFILGSSSYQTPPITESTPVSIDEPIAIVGMGCRFPGRVDSPESLWRLLVEGADALEEVPKKRFDAACFSSLSQAQPRGGFLQGVEMFDAGFFGVSAKEARSMDPQQRIVLETCWEALEDAGESAEEIFGSKTGVCIGAMASDYHGEELENVDSFYTTGSAPNAIPGRVSYFFGFHGPAVSIDTGCSSSLVALDTACRYLRTRSCDRVLAGGVNVILSSHLSVLLSKTGALSESGKCATFDAAADGYARSEGCGVLVLKRLSDAERNGDRVLALIRGTAVNQDGRGISFTAPNGQSQVAVLKEALQNSNLAPEDVSYIEAHGTGTPLGDPIEVQALGEVFRNRTNPLYIGSVKTNIGHTEAAAGVAGVIKTVLALRNETIPKHIHFSELNPNIDLQTGKMKIPTDATAWKRISGRRRIAGVSSFGISGTNAHVILEEAPYRESLIPKGAAIAETKFPEVFVISAKTESSLREISRKFAQALEQSHEAELRDICASVATGRSHFDFRLAVVVHDLESLKQGLMDFHLGRAPKVSTELFYGKCVGRNGKTQLAAESHSDTAFEPKGLAQRYVAGEKIDWVKRFGRHRRVGLPTYAFERQRHWFDRTEEESTRTFEQVLSLNKQSYLKGHVIHGRVVVPASAFVEFASRGSRELLGEDTLIRNMSIDTPLVMSQEGEHALRLVLDRREQPCGFVIQSSNFEKDVWTTHVTGQLMRMTKESSDVSLEALLGEMGSLCTKEKGVGEFYKQLADMGFSYSGEYVCAKEIFYGETGVVAKLESPTVDDSGYLIHPALLDGCLQVGFSPFVGEQGRPIYMPIGVGEVRLNRRPSGPLWVFVKFGDPLDGANHGVRNQEVLVFDEAGLVVELYQVASREVTSQSLERVITKSDIRGRVPRNNDDILYEISWVAKDSKPIAHHNTDTWLILSDRRGLGEELAALVRQRGGKVQTVFPEETISSEALQFLGQEGSFARIVHLWSLECENCEFSTEALSTSQRLGYESGLNLVKSLQEAGIQGVKLSFVTNQAQTVFEKQARVNFLQTSILGLSRVINHEHPEFKSTTIDIEFDENMAVSKKRWLAEVLFRELVIGDEEREVAFRAEKRYVPRLGKATDRANLKPVSDVQSEGTYLITGGLGDLGLKMAEYLVSRGAKNLVLVARSQPQPTASRLLEEWRTQGVRTAVVQADVCEPHAVKSVFDVFEGADAFPSLRGIFHCAGVLADGLLGKQDRDSFQQVMLAKLVGAWNLHMETRARKLDFFVLFSSISSVLGNPGQANYAAANALMDGFSHFLRGQGFDSALSINWGPWDDIGWVREKSAQRFLNRRNAHFLSIEQGFHSLDSYLRYRQPAQVLSMNMNWPDYLKFLPEDFSLSFFSDLKIGSATSSATNFRSDILGFLKTEIVQLLGINPDDIDVHSSLMDMGLDSLMVVELRNSLKKAIGGEKGRSLPTTVVFNHPTLNSLHDFLLTYLEIQVPAEEHVKPQEANAEVEPIAIVGMSCRFPGGVNGPEDFWKMLDHGRDGIGGIPRSRFDVEKYYSEDASEPGKTYVRHGGFLEGIEQFDSRFFGISPKEALALDPQQRLLLEVSWEAFEQQGESFEKVFDSKTGVFVGVMYQDYSDRLSHSSVRDQIEMYIPSGAAASALAGRLSYFFNFSGPALSLDTACSSSLSALHLACESLRNGSCERALAGGVNVILSPVGYTAMSRARAFSAKGKCATFDASADGYVRSEGCGVVVLKRLSDAKRDGDQVLALIRGTAVNQDGRSISFTAPNGRAQVAVIQEALSAAGVEPDDVGYVEAHGTGTPLGDPIELQAIAEVFKERSAPLVVGSVKTNIGHTESAAGIAGVIKVVLSMQHGTIPKHLHFERLNSNIEIDPKKVQIPVEALKWRRNHNNRRVAGVSSFGISGTNAHVILEEAPSHEKTAPSIADKARENVAHEVFVLSAKTDVALNDLVSRYLCYLDDNVDISLRDLCASAAVGRAHFGSRLAVIASDLKDLKAKLVGFLGGMSPEASAQVSEISKRLAQSYLDGEKVEWVQHFGFYNRLKLPTYPFQRQTFWVDGDEYRRTREKNEHPLLGKLIRSSSLESEFIFEHEFGLATLDYLSGHKVFGHVVVPGAAYLEMAMSAGRTVYDGPVLVENISIDAPMTLKDLETKIVQLVVTKDATGAHFKISSRPRESTGNKAKATTAWTMHAAGRIVTGAFDTGAGRPSEVWLSSLGERCSDVVSAPDFYKRLTGLGFDYSGMYQGVQEARFSSSEVIAQVLRSQSLAESLLPADDGYSFHPALLDSCLHAGFAAIEKNQKSLFMPIGIERYISYRKAEGRLWSHMTFRPIENSAQSLGVRTVDVRIWNEQGMVAEIQGLTSREATADALHRMIGQTKGDANEAAIYEVVWQRADLDLTPKTGHENWLILSDRLGVGEHLANLIRTKGGTATLAYAGANSETNSDTTIREGLRRSPSRIVHLWSLDCNPPGGEDASASTARYHNYESALALVQAAKEAGLLTQMTFVTALAQSVGANQKRTNFQQSSLLGLVRVVKHEYPELESLMLDLDLGEDSESLGVRLFADRVFEEVVAGSAEREVAYRRNTRYVPRLLRANHRPKEFVVSDPGDSAYLITGGLGGIGFSLAKYLVVQGARHLILIGRSNPTSSVLSEIENLRKQGVRVHIGHFDIASSEQIHKMFSWIRQDLTIPQVRGVAHCAGSYQAAPLVRQTGQDFEKLSAAKLGGAMGLYQAIQHLQQFQGKGLEFFALFSSTSSLLGYPGLASYAAANAELDGFAHNLRSRGVPAHSINWGAWSGVGMATQIDSQRIEALRESGEFAITPDEGVRNFGLLVSDNIRAQSGVMKMDWEAYIQSLPSRASKEMYASLAEVKKLHFDREETDLVLRLRRMDRDTDREAELLSYLKAEVAKLLGKDVGEISDDESLIAMGMDSLMAVELRNLIKHSVGRQYGKDIPAVLIFSHPTIRSISHLVLGLLGGEKKVKPPTKVAEPLRKSSEPIAVVGMSCRFPGGVSSPEDFWNLLRTGQDAVGGIPKSRFDIDKYYDVDPNASGKTYLRRGGFLEGLDQFDPQFFGISPREAMALDPQQRLLLEVCWEALERAGEPLDLRKKHSTDVYIGSSSTDFLERLLSAERRSQIEDYIPTGATPSVMVGRLSYFFNFKGSAIPIDTACASSLSALHMACESLRNGASDRAIAGGVNVILSPMGYLPMSRLRTLSTVGRCATFDAEADGYVRSEGCGVLVLKRLSDAIENGDQILALIRGTAVNQDGRSISMTAPNGQTQAAVMREALEASGIEPEEVSYIEAHGTGTPLGDSIELQSIGEVFGDRRSPLVVGSVKTNIGHTEAASGVAGVIKAILSMQNERIPKHLHFTKLSVHSDIDPDKIRIPTSEQEWKRAPNRRRIAGISSFGISGTNAHVIVEEAPVVAETPSSTSSSQTVFVLSAKNESALRELARRYLRSLAQPVPVSLHDICASAGVGRSHFECRLAIVASSVEDLRGKIVSFLEQGPSDIVFYGTVKGTAALASAEEAELEDLEKADVLSLKRLAQLYVSGAQVNWQRLFGFYKKINLPTYAFQRQSFWIE